MEYQFNTDSAGANDFAANRWGMQLEKLCFGERCCIAVPLLFQFSCPKLEDRVCPRCWAPCIASNLLPLWSSRVSVAEICDGLERVPVPEMRDGFNPLLVRTIGRLWCQKISPESSDERWVRRMSRRLVFRRTLCRLFIATPRISTIPLDIGSNTIAENYRVHSFVAVSNLLSL